MPAMVRISVVLPAPLPPTTATVFAAVRHAATPRTAPGAPFVAGAQSIDLEQRPHATLALSAEIALDHPRIRHHPRPALPSAIFSPWVQHHDVVGMRHHHPHDMFDQQEWSCPSLRSACSTPDDAVGIGRAQRRHHLVEHQQPRPGGQRLAEFEHLAVRQRRQGRRRLPGHGRRGPIRSRISIARPGGPVQRSRYGRNRRP